MDQSIIFFLAAILILGGVLLAFVGLTRKSGKKYLNVDHYRVKWLQIEQQLTKDVVSSYSMTVLYADKLLDQALRERGLRGNTMAERLKAGSSLFSNRNTVWTAHKLRNQIAHEPDVSVSYDNARHALSGFKQALKDIGAI
jgi:hypothetical protein